MTIVAILFSNCSLYVSLWNKQKTTTNKQTHIYKHIYKQTHIQTFISLRYLKKHCKLYTYRSQCEDKGTCSHFCQISYRAHQIYLFQWPVMYVLFFVSVTHYVCTVLCFSDPLCMYCSLFQWPIMYVLFFVSVTHYICTVLCFSDPLYVLFFVSVTHWWCFLVECHMTVQVEHHVSQWWQESPPLYSRWNTPS